MYGTAANALKAYNDTYSIFLDYLLFVKIDFGIIIPIYACVISISVSVQARDKSRTT